MAFWDCTGLTSIYIPNSVTSIGYGAFEGCSDLTSIDIPNSVASIDDWAFGECRILSSVTVRNPDPSNISIKSKTFGSSPISTCTLYVPKGSKELYEQAEVWKEFGTIVEIEDDQLNYFAAEDVSGFKNSVIDINVDMVNEEEICAFQFDVVLPDGFEIEADDEDYLLYLSERAKKSHSVSSSINSQGNVRYLVYSSSNAAFSSNEGMLFSLPVIATAPGDYQVTISNIELTTTANKEILCDDIVVNVHVSDYIPGDANGDGKVSVTDVVCIVSEIMRTPFEGFVREAADVNGDGEITVTDIVGVVDIILNQ